jgi:hypothetical protein
MALIHILFLIEIYSVGLFHLLAEKQFLEKQRKQKMPIVLRLEL